jgi:hypothetical protein
MTDTAAELNPAPIGEAPARGDEPRAAYAATYANGLTDGGCRTVIDAALAVGLVRRGDNRCDHLHVTDFASAMGLFGGVALDVVHMMATANRRWWGLQLDGYAFKVLRYRPGQWAPGHVDMFPGSMRRKLTLVAQLTEPGAYVGGKLEVQPMADAWQEIPRGLGTCAVFPSWTRHRVTHVEHGERWTLAAWGYGPPVR